MSDLERKLEFLPVDVSLDRSNTISQHVSKCMSESQNLFNNPQTDAKTCFQDGSFPTFRHLILGVAASLVVPTNLKYLNP